MEEKQVAKPVPVKVWGGEISPNGLVLETKISQEKIPWQDVEILCTGRIKDSMDTGSPKPSAGLKGRFQKMSRSEHPSQNVKTVQSGCLLAYMFIRGYNAPFRFDSVGTNFKKFLGPDAGYSGEINFINFINKVAENAVEAQVDDSTMQMLERGKKWLAEYESAQVMVEAAWKLNGDANYRVDL